MYGPFGCGKSAVAQSLAEQYERKGRLAAAFFFFRNAGERSSSSGFATTLAHQIALNVPGARELIQRVVSQEPGVVEPSRSLVSQLGDLVYGPLLGSLAEGGVAGDDPYLVIVDGLDECMDKEGITTFIDSSIQFFSRNPGIPLRLFITSRVEEHIRTHIEAETATIHLADLARRSSRADIKRYMTCFFTEAKKHDRSLQALGELWPAPDDMGQLVDYCDGTFIFGSTLARFILYGLGDRDPRTPMERLPLALKITPGIDGVYAEILSSAQHLPHFYIVISTIACVFTPLSISAMAALLGISTYEIIRVVVGMQAILHIPGRDDEVVTVFHSSFRDFLQDKNRSGDCYSPPSHHTYLMHRCLDLLLGPEPTANIECCKYAMIYWGAHFEVGARLDSEFDLDSLQSDRPYNPIDRREWATRNFQSRRGEGRPVSFLIPVAEWLTMTKSMSGPFRLFTMRNFSEAGVYHAGHVDPRRWSSSSSPQGELSTVESLHICSFSDIVQGFRLLREGASLGERDSCTVSVKRGSGIVIVVKVTWFPGQERTGHAGWKFAVEQCISTE